MKCPQCNYVSFEYLDSCRKCSNDLTAHKSQFGIEFLEPLPLGVLAYLESNGSNAPVKVDTDSATFGTDDFKLAGDSTDGATDEVAIERSEDAVAVVEEDTELEALIEEPAAVETATVPEIPEEEDEGITLLEEDVSPIEEASDIQTDDIAVLDDVEVEEEAPVGGLDLNLDEDTFEEQVKEQGDNIDGLNLDTTISGDLLEDESLDETAANTAFSLNIGDDLDTESQLEIDDLPSLDEGDIPALDSDEASGGAAEPETIEMSDVVVEGAVANGTDEVISIDTLDTDSELDVSLDGLDEDIGIGGDEISMQDEDADIDISIDGEQIEGLELNLDISLEDDDNKEEDRKDKTAFSEEDLDLQIGDDSIDFD